MLWAVIAVLWIAISVFLVLASGSDHGNVRTEASAHGIGYHGFLFEAANVSRPTSSESQSKLWYNDGKWWGSLFDRATGKYRIYRYDRPARAWIDTGTDIDERNSSKSDVLWDGEHLYVVSAGPDSSSEIQSGRVMRYSYDATTEEYSLDPGFPVTMTSGGAEALVLEKDTTGTLWVTYTQDSKVLVGHTLKDDTTWTKPFVLPVRGTTVDHDDVSTMVAFDSQVGVMWSNQAENTIYFAIHRDGDAPDEWRAATALRASDAARSAFRLQKADIADDHISLKADSSGRVFAAVKTSFDEPGSNPDAPTILLLTRSRDGAWSSHVFGRKSDGQTRPVLMVDEERGDLYVFATAPCCGLSRLPRSRGGDIYYKRTGLDDISFPEGRGTPFIQSATDKDVNDVTSAKRNPNGVTEVPLLSSDNVSGRYLHNVIDLEP